jgi:hypothetical protein
MMVSDIFEIDAASIRFAIIGTFLLYAVPALKTFVHHLIQISGALAGNEVLPEVATDVKKVAKANQAMAKLLREMKKDMEAMRKALEAQSRFSVPQKSRKLKKRRQVQLRTKRVAVAHVNALMTGVLKEKASVGVQTTENVKLTKIGLTPTKIVAQISQEKSRSSDATPKKPEITRLPKVGEIAIFGLKDIVKVVYRLFRGWLRDATGLIYPLRDLEVTRRVLTREGI